MPVAVSIAAAAAGAISGEREGGRPHQAGRHRQIPESVRSVGEGDTTQVGGRSRSGSGSGSGSGWGGNTPFYS